MSDWRPDQLLRIGVDGSVEPIDQGYQSIRDAIGNWIDFVTVTRDVGFYIDDEGMLRNLPLNITASLMAQRALYGPAVLCRGVPDDEGDTLPPVKTAVLFAEKLGYWWRSVIRSAASVGQDPYSYPNAETIPPPQIVELPKDWLQ